MLGTIPVLIKIGTELFAVGKVAAPLVQALVEIAKRDGTEEETREQLVARIDLIIATAQQIGDRADAEIDAHKPAPDQP